YNRLHDTVIAEAGAGVPDVSRFIKNQNTTGQFVTDPEEIDTTIPGVYDIEIRIGKRTYRSKLEIKDTIPPEGSAVNREVPSGRVLAAEDFVTDITDATQVAVSFESQPDFTSPGVKEVKVLLEDRGGNVTEKKAVLTVLEDNEPPRIIGAHDRTVYIGDRVSYRRDVTVIDNLDQDAVLHIDSSAVNLKREGAYPVIYTASDVSGNTTSITVTYTVEEKPEDYVDPDELDKLVDEVLAGIINDEMTQREKAKAIYDWTKYSIKYIEYPDMGDWVKAAYLGIKNRRGDCFIFYSTAQALLTRAGIENQRIVKTGGGHYWNLVNCGDGWYHFDTTPRRGGGEFFMLTDAQLEEYSRKHKNSHVWDKSKYPATPLE
ncbi:MAG TPA: transglutaminase-like domain-containing protein, partial [Bacillota bacterium]|nr:transglutaminase-like domain-containing protein [Bacillota bacterium]